MKMKVNAEIEIPKIDWIAIGFKLGLGLSWGVLFTVGVFALLQKFAHLVTP